MTRRPWTYGPTHGPPTPLEHETTGEWSAIPSTWAPGDTADLAACRRRLERAEATVEFWRRVIVDDGDAADAALAAAPFDRILAALRGEDEAALLVDPVSPEAARIARIVSRIDEQDQP